MLKSSLCASSINLGPGINEMLGERKPSLVNIQLKLLKILHPANHPASSRLVQRPQKFSAVLSAPKIL